MQEEKKWVQEACISKPAAPNPSDGSTCAAERDKAGFLTRCYPSRFARLEEFAFDKKRVCQASAAVRDHRRRLSSVGFPDGPSRAAGMARSVRSRYRDRRCGE